MTSGGCEGKRPIVRDRVKIGGGAMPVGAGRGEAWHGKAGHGETRQDKTRFSFFRSQRNGGS